MTQKELPSKILKLVMAYQRKATPSCGDGQDPCERCLQAHVGQVESCVAQGKPVDFVLPAFPGKSPNRSKVLGPVPDMAECLSLGFLQMLCQRIQEIYPPGARVIICSDGRVFSDLVHIPDSDITAYQVELKAMIHQKQYTSISLFNLDDEFESCSFDEMRQRLVNQYGEPLDALKAQIREGGEPLSLYRGITRFLLEDASGPNVKESRTALQKECRVRAYGVIQRSKAWGNLVAQRFPKAVRLSIHPQPCGSEKLGIHLLETADNWLTPWHGAAVELGGRFVLMKRYQAEELGATLVFSQGRPSHFVAPTPSTTLSLVFPHGPRVATNGRSQEQA
jgi:pyoverdine/dityrosine biosynthesis protein Dit1